MRRAFFLLGMLFSALLPGFAAAAEMRLAVTTSFQNSGLADYLIPAIEKDTGITLRLVVVGTGQALKLGQSGDVDALMVHSPDAEKAFVAAGHATRRREIMFNDFVIAGPAHDPAGIGSATSAADAFSRIASASARFVSRGDKSGTHQKERKIWFLAGTENPAGSWYLEAGSGMGTVLNIAAGMNAYVLTDRASWLNFGNKANLELLFSGDPELFNQYAFLPVNPARHPHVKADLAADLEAWLTGPHGQQMIGNYAINGQKLFTPNAEPAN